MSTSYLTSLNESTGSRFLTFLSPEQTHAVMKQIVKDIEQTATA
jgi:hypothetical protein